LSDACPVSVRVRGRRWAHRARGRDPDDLDVQMEDVANSLNSAMKMLEEDAAALGIDLHAPLVEPPTPIETARIRSASMAHTMTLYRLRDVLDETDSSLRPVRESLSRAAAIVAPKLARLCASDPETWAWDAIPNLLLVELVDTDTRAKIEAAVDRFPRDLLEAYTDTRERMFRLTEHWFGTISSADRADFDRMVAEQRAPSPFAVRDETEDEPMHD
jgi:hypothetical protein